MSAPGASAASILQGRPAAELSDEELESQGTQAHATRNWVFLHGTAEQFARHTSRMLELEQEYLRRHPHRTWQGSGGAASSPRDEAAALRDALRGIVAQLEALAAEPTHEPTTASSTTDPVLAVLAAVAAAPDGRLHKLEVHQAAREAGLDRAALAALYTSTLPLLTVEQHDRVLTDAGRDALHRAGRLRAGRLGAGRLGAGRRSGTASAPASADWRWNATSTRRGTRTGSASSAAPRRVSSTSTTRPARRSPVTGGRCAPRTARSSVTGGWTSPGATPRSSLPSTPTRRTRGSARSSSTTWNRRPPTAARTTSTTRSPRPTRGASTCTTGSAPAATSAATRTRPCASGCSPTPPPLDVRLPRPVTTHRPARTRPVAARTSAATSTSTTTATDPCVVLLMAILAGDTVEHIAQRAGYPWVTAQRLREERSVATQRRQPAAYRERVNRRRVG